MASVVPKDGANHGRLETARALCSDASGRLIEPRQSTCRQERLPRRVCNPGSRLAIFLALPALVVGRNQANCPTGSPKISRIRIARSASKIGLQTLAADWYSTCCL